MSNDNSKKTAEEVVMEALKVLDRKLEDCAGICNNDARSAALTWVNIAVRKTVKELTELRDKELAAAKRCEIEEQYAKEAQKVETEKPMSVTYGTVTVEVTGVDCTVEDCSEDLCLCNNRLYAILVKKYKDLVTGEHYSILREVVCMPIMAGKKYQIRSLKVPSNKQVVPVHWVGRDQMT